MINDFLPKFGNDGTDIVVTGTGFNNATGAQVNGIAAPFLKVSDTEVRISVPENATTGKITILDPDGNQVSANDFVVRQPTAPENTARGREAIDRIYLAIAAKVRGDLGALARSFARSVVLVDPVNGMQDLIEPPASDVVETNTYQTALGSATPNNSFQLSKMLLLGSQGVYVLGYESVGDENRFQITLRRTSNGYQICSIDKNAS